MIAVNAKIKNASHRTANFGLPAFRSESGEVTCPNAGRCAASCYARQGFYNMPSVTRAYETRLAFTKAPDFVPRMVEMIEKKRLRAFRWNDSGDFYSRDYLRKAFKVMRATPDVRHYAYTKQVKLLKSVEEIWPRNFTVIFSLGGKQDSLIDLKNDRHARVFDSREELRFSGYADASIDDSIAWRSSNHKIGLVYHGQKKNSFTIAEKREEREKSWN